MGFPDLQVDHKDGDYLNNTDENLRLATSRQNNYNRTAKRENTSSKYKGVSLNRKSGKFLAFITYEGKRVSLGLHREEEFAAKVRDLATIKLHGEFGVLNFPDIEIVNFDIEKFLVRAKPVWKTQKI